jgi:basic membrane protein A and related proteins
VKVSRWVLLACAGILAVGLAAGGALINSDSGSAAAKATFKAALVSDIGSFSDKSFNESQLDGLKRAKANLGVDILPLESKSTAQYAPNLNKAVRGKADLVIAAGFLLANATATYAKKFPDTRFAITDYGAGVPPLGDKNFKPLYKNVEGLTYAANESGCLVGVLAAKMAQKAGKKIIGAVGGIKIPPVDIWIAGYRFCAKKAVPGTQILINYSQDFNAIDKCKTQAENLIGRGAKVLFQVAGLCGQGTLKAADEAGIWGIGVDKDQYNDAKRVLTSGVKRVDNGVYQAIQRAKAGQFKGGSDVLFNLKNKGMGVGRINPAVPASYKALMNSYKAKIIKGTLKVPAAL